MTVRLAVRRDEPAIYRHLMRLYAENALATLDPAKLQKKIKAATRAQGGIIGLIDGASGPIASIGLELEQWWYSADWYLCELWVFVDKGHRGESHETALIEFAKHCAGRLGLPLLMGIISANRTEAKTRLYRRQIPPIGALFLHRVGGA